jgi:uncharacterized membrane protein
MKLVLIVSMRTDVHMAKMALGVLLRPQKAQHIKISKNIRIIQKLIVKYQDPMH